MNVTAGQIERWRKAGLLPPPKRRGRGQGRGSVSAYPPGTVAQVRTLLRILERHRNLDKAAVLLKLHGYTVSLRALKRALLNLWVEPLHALDPSKKRLWGTQAGAAAAADQVLTHRQRSEHDRDIRESELRRAGGRAALRGHYIAVLLPLFGGLDEHALLAALDAHGLGAGAQTLTEAAPALRTLLVEMAGQGELNVDRLRESIDKLQPAHLDGAVRAARVFLAALEALGMQAAPEDRFYADCVSAIHQPDRRPQPVPNTPETEAEQQALAFFASKRRSRTNQHPEATSTSS